MENKDRCNPKDIEIEYPRIDTADQLYLYYKLMYTEEISDDIMKDCPRCNFNKTQQFKFDPRTLKNPLFNVLNAYAHYDPEVAYGQGMNYICANILVYMQSSQSPYSNILTEE